MLRAFDDGPARLPVRREGSLVFHELLMSLTRRSFSMPPDGLGASRFAILHREKVRSAIRHALTIASTPLHHNRRTCTIAPAPMHLHHCICIIAPAPLHQPGTLGDPPADADALP